MPARTQYAARVLALVALILGVGAATACSDDIASPTPPSPGPLGGDGAEPAPIHPPPTTEGPGLSAPGIRLTAVPRGDGSFEITENVALRDASTVLRVRPPDSGERLQGMMRRTTPEVVGLQVIADGELQPTETVVRQERDLRLGKTATRFTLTYRLTGSSVHSLPSPVGRALAAISPLTAPTDGTLPTNLAVNGSLLNASCPMLPEPRCAVGDPPKLGIQQRIPARQALVVLQLNLPLQP